MAGREWTEKHIMELIKRELNKLDGASYTFSMASNDVNNASVAAALDFFHNYQPSSAMLSDKFIDLLPTTYYPKRDDNYEYKYVTTLLHSNFDNNCYKKPFWGYETKRNIVLICPYLVTNYFPTALIDGFYIFNNNFNNNHIGYIETSIEVLKSTFVIQGDKKFALGIGSVLGNTEDKNYNGFIYNGSEYGLPYWSSPDGTDFYRPSTTVYMQVEPDEIKSFNDQYNVFSSWSEFDWEEKTHTVCYNNVYRKNL